MLNIFESESGIKEPDAQGEQIKMDSDNEIQSTDLNINDNAEIKEIDTKISASKGKRRKVMKEIIEWAEAVIIALVVALLIRNYVFTLVTVVGSSMEPTLHQSENLYVNRFMYTPQKGDIVIITPTVNQTHAVLNSSDGEGDELSKDHYVKRVIATEGDSLYIDPATGKVYVNDEEQNEPYINRVSGRNIRGAFMERLISQGNYSRSNPLIIEKDHIFVMGDNRGASSDSRAFGPVKTEQVTGKAMFRLWPIDKFGSLY